jgi:serralysin
MNFASMESLQGGSGADTFTFNNGQGVTGKISGGVETDPLNKRDTLDYAAYTTAVKVDLLLGTATGAAKGVEQIENVTGGSANDILTGDHSNNMLAGGAGNDALNGLGGNDTLQGGAGNDVYRFHAPLLQETDTVVELPGGGNDHLKFNALSASSPVVVDLGSDTTLATHANRTVRTGAAGQAINFENATGGAGNDTLIGNAVGNFLDGQAGNDTLRGLGGGDNLYGEGGSDTLEGGAGSDLYYFRAVGASETDTLVELPNGGTDHISFESAPATQPVTVNLTSDTALATQGNRLVRTGGSGQAANFERVTGGAGNDIITGNAANNWLRGLGGNDVLSGGAGHDTYHFDADLALGSDTVNDTGGSRDTLDFTATTTRGVTVNLASRAAQVVNAGLSLTLTSDSIERVLGSTMNDVLTGNALNNTLWGNRGNDTLNGGAGRDVLIGGLDVDTLRGNEGEDLLIGGRLSYDANASNHLAALDAIMGEWGRSLTYQQRIGHLTGALAGGNNGSFRLTAATVVDDAGAADTLEGGAHLDWFFQDQNDAISDRNNGGPETVTVI